MVCGQRVTAPASARPAPAMKDNEKGTNDMQQETTAPGRPAPSSAALCGKPTCRVRAIEACADDGWSEAALREELAQENARLFVAEAEGKVAGLAVFQLVCGEASLYAVSTAPAFRRRGVARALLSRAFAALCLQGAQDVFLKCAPRTAPRRRCTARSALCRRACAGTFMQRPRMTPC